MVDLYLHDPGFDATEEKAMARGMFGVTDELMAVQDWMGLAAAIMRHGKIGRLVFSFHSFDGGMIVGGNGKQLGEAAVKALFTKPTQVDTIAFGGCNVGNRPSQMLAFAKIFGAKMVSGYTWSMVKQTVRVRFPKGTTEAKIKGTLDPLAPYSVDMLPAANLVKTQALRKDHEAKLVCCYGSIDGSTTSMIPIPFGEQRGRKPWKDAKEKMIRAVEAEKTEREYQASPVVAFECVRVTL
jgi:hypothetical protein